jgi:hypothetical protein
LPKVAFGHKKSEDRRPVDFYPTPDRLAVACCRAAREIVPLPEYILEPSAGSGAFVRAARKIWGSSSPIHAVELRQEEHDNLLSCDTAADGVSICSLEDFLLGPSFVAKEKVLAIGNPPYSLAQVHILLLLDNLLPGSHIAFLLKLGFLGTKDRADLLWKQGQCKYVWPILGRPSFVKGDRASSDVNEYALFVWEVGYTGPTFIRWPHIRWKGVE